MRKLLLGLFLSFILFSTFGSYKVYVIHGYGGTTAMMSKIDKSLKAEHFITENFAYKSISVDLDSIGMELYLNIKKSGFDTVSFVTHSMGGLVVRSMLQYAQKDSKFPVIHRIVMIAPPNKGAEIADFFTKKTGMKRLLGPNVEHMRTDSNSYAYKLPIPINSELGIIIGYTGKSYGYNPFINSDNDGLLTPKSAKLGVEKDVVFIKAEHNLLTQNYRVIKYTIDFLKFGKFASIPI